MAETLCDNSDRKILKNITQVSKKASKYKLAWSWPWKDSRNDSSVDVVTSHVDKVYAIPSSFELEESETQSQQAIELEEDKIYLPSFEETRQAIEDHEVSSSTKFSSWITKGNFNETLTGSNLSKHKLLFEDCNGKVQQIKFDGTPFVIAGSKTYDCHHGPDRNSKAKLKRKQQYEARDDDTFVKKKFRERNTKKFDCPAKIVVREVISFPKYKLAKDTEWQRRKTSRSLKNEWKSERVPDYERRFYIRFPETNEHRNHVIGEAQVNVAAPCKRRHKRLKDEDTCKEKSQSDEVSTTEEELMHQIPTPPKGNRVKKVKYSEAPEQIKVKKGENYITDTEAVEAKQQKPEDGFILKDGICAVCRSSYSASGIDEVLICCGVMDSQYNVIDGCGGWFHLRCTDLINCNLTTKELQVLRWYCQACTAVASISSDINL